MRIKVRTLHRGDFEFNIPEDATLSLLRTAIEERTGIPPDRQRLIFRGKPLYQDESLLKDCGLDNDLTIHMVERTNGKGKELVTENPSEDNRTAEPSVQHPRTSVINGEMIVSRSAAFQDSDAVLSAMRSVLSNLLPPGSIDYNITTAVNTPSVGDFSVFVRIVDNGEPIGDSVSMDRLIRVANAIDRNHRTIDILQNEIWQRLSSNDFAADRQQETEAEMIRLDECILSLEEIMTLPLPNDDCRLLPGQVGGNRESDEVTSSERLHLDQLRRSGTSVRHATNADYAEVMDRLLALQNRVNEQIRNLQSILNLTTQFSQSERENSIKRSLFAIYQEHMRRITHRLGHIYHSLSDISSSMMSDRPLEPCGVTYDNLSRTEIRLSVAFVTRRNEEARIQAASPASNSNAAVSRGSSSPQIAVGEGGHSANTGSTGSNAGAPPISVMSTRTRLTPQAAPDNGGQPSSTSGAESNANASSTPVISSQPRPQEMGASSDGSNSLHQLIRNIVGSATGIFPGLIAQRPNDSLGARVDRNDGSNAQQQQLQQQPRGPNVLPSVSVRMMRPARADWQHSVIGQVVVHANGPGDLEETRRAVDAAMHTANAIAASNGIQGQRGAVRPPSSQPNVRHNGFHWVRRGYSNRSPPPNATESSRVMFIGPRSPNYLPLYTADPYLTCHSQFCNPRSSIRFSAEYDRVITAYRQAALQYEATLVDDPARLSHAQSISARWQAVRDGNSLDAQIVTNARGETLFENLEQFSSVLGRMLRRALANMAETDPDVNRSYAVTQGEIETFNYEINPLAAARDMLRIPGLSAEVDIVPSVAEVHEEHMEVDTAQAAAPANTESTQSTQSSVPSGDVANETSRREDDSPHADVLRNLTGLIQSGRHATLAEILREMGQPVSKLEGGFVNLVFVMACELLEWSELLQLFAGNFALIASRRQQMRHFIIDHILDSNNRPSDEDLRSATERVMLSEAQFNSLLSFDDVRRYVDVPEFGRIDVMSSALGVERRCILELLRLALHSEDAMPADDFSQRACSLFKYYAHRAIILANISMSNNPFDYEMLLTRILGSPSDTVERHRLMGWMSRVSMERLRELLHNDSPFSLHDMRDELVIINRGNEVVQNEVDGSGKASEQDKIQETGKKNTFSTSRATVFSQDRKAVGEQRTALKTMPAGYDESLDRTFSEELKEGMNLLDLSDDRSWTNLVPKEWVPIIQKDRSQMLAMSPQQSFSNAYQCLRSDEAKGKRSEGKSCIKRKEDVPCASSGDVSTPSAPERNDGRKDGAQESDAGMADDDECPDDLK